MVQGENMTHNEEEIAEKVLEVHKKELVQKIT